MRPFSIMLLILVALFYWVGTGNIQLFDWDEINFAEISREMVLSGNYWQPTINFFPFHEKPPLFSWLQVFCFQTIGINEMAARLPNVICGLITLAALFYIGNRWRGKSFGYWWAAFMAFSLLPQFYFRSGIIDPWFNLFIFLGLAYLVVPDRSKSVNWRLLASGLLLGLGVMTKGPVALLIAGLCLGVWLLTGGRSFRFWWWRYATVGLLALLPILAWVAYVWTLDDGFFAREFIIYQWRLFSQPDAGHGGFFGYHFVVLLIGCFPASVFALPRLLRKSGEDSERLMKILFWVVLILFSLVSTKIVHYSSLAYFPLSYLAAAHAETLQHGAKQNRKWHWLSQGIIGLFAFVLLLLPVVIHLVLPNISFHDLDYRSSKVFSKASAFYLPILAIPLMALVWYLKKIYNGKQQSRYVAAQLLGTTYFVVAGLLFYIKPIQFLTQGACVAFFEEKSQEDAYLTTTYYKSYVPLFYGKIKPENGKRTRDYCLNGAIDRPVYFSSPERRTEQVLKENPGAKLLRTEGGYSFYYRPVSE